MAGFQTKPSRKIYIEVENGSSLRLGGEGG